jgi:hypothetical protein
MTDRIRLGQIRAPSGVIVVIDPGCAAHWTFAEEDCGKEDVRPFRPPSCDGVPADRALSVFGEPEPEGAEEGCWRRICLEIEPDGVTASAEPIGVIGGVRSRLLLCDAASLTERQACGVDPDGVAALEGGWSCGFPICSGEAFFDVVAERDAVGRLLRLCILRRSFECLSKFAMVTSGVMVEGKPVTCLFREPPVGDTDSGWVLTSGESRDQVDDARHIHLVRLRDVMRMHPEVTDLLRRSPVGSAFKRKAGGEFFTVEFCEFRDSGGSSSPIEGEEG